MCSTIRFDLSQFDFCHWLDAEYYRCPLGALQSLNNIMNIILTSFDCTVCNLFFSQNWLDPPLCLGMRVRRVVNFNLVEHFSQRSYREEDKFQILNTNVSGWRNPCACGRKDPWTWTGTGKGKVGCLRNRKIHLVAYKGS
jgi:hypothetical protein